MSESRQRIRIGLIGLSASGSWASHAHLPYLLSAQGRKRYTITALCNSSEAAARAAIATYRLDDASNRDASEPAVRAHGSPEALAADPAVDLVVVCVRAPLHAAAARAALAARKRVFVEYPLGTSAAESRALLADAAAAGVAQTDLLCGLEEAFDAVVGRVKTLVNGGDGGRIGRVLQTTFDACGYPLAGSVPAAHEYALTAANGAGSIGAAHLLNAITHVLGPLHGRCEARALNLQPEADIVDAPGPRQKVLRRVVKDTPDHTVIAGQLAATTTTAAGSRHAGAALVGTFRTDRKWPGEPTIVWRIMGERGQIRVTVPDMMAPEFDDGTRIEVFDYESGAVEEVEWRRGEEDGEVEAVLSKLPGAARSIGRTYEAFADGTHVGVADWESATDLQAMVEEMLTPNST